MHYQIVKGGDIPYFIIELYGEFNIKAFEKCLIELFIHPQWRLDLDVLYDAQNCTLGHLSKEDINELNRMTNKFRDKTGRGKVAWVVNHGREVDMGVSRMYQLMFNDTVTYDLQVFKSIGDAHFWIETNDLPGM